MASELAVEVEVGTRLRLGVAVTDGPEGVAVVAMPPGRAAALRLKKRYGNVFWCTSAAGGCGRLLEVIAGRQRATHFRHKARGVEGLCRFEDDPQRAQRAYAHLFYQRELARWLAGQGLQGQIEKVLSDGTTRGGRTDLHVVVEGVRHSLEVQLSPISGVELWARTARYRQHVDQVWWLFGPGAEAAAAEYRANASDELVLRLRQEDPDDAGTKQVLIGVQSAYIAGVQWAPLAQCRLDADGVWTPHLEGATRAAGQVAAERAQQAEQRRAQLEQERLDRDALIAARAEREARAAARTLADAPGARPFIEVGREVPGRVRHGSSIAVWRDPWHPEFYSWEQDQDWAWLLELPAVDHEPARFITYLVQVLYFAGPVKMFHLPDVPDAGRIIAALQGAGMLQLSERAGVDRWQRTVDWSVP